MLLNAFALFSKNGLEAVLRCFHLCLTRCSLLEHFPTWETAGNMDFLLRLAKEVSQAEGDGESFRFGSAPLGVCPIAKGSFSTILLSNGFFASFFLCWMWVKRD